MLDYNMDPITYENRSTYSSRERYIKNYWQPIIYRYIDTYCKNKTVVDIGCGTGAYTRIISKNTDRNIGLDISRKMLKYASQTNKSCYIQSSADYLPLKEESVDVVICIGLLEYVKADCVISEIYRILKPKGICIIQCPNKYSAMRMVVKIAYKILGKNYLQNELSNKDICKILNNKKLNILVNKMDDGLIWLPNIIDNNIGLKLYSIIEKLFRPLKYNPFSNIMLYVVEK